RPPPPAAPARRLDRPGPAGPRRVGPRRSRLAPPILNRWEGRACRRQRDECLPLRHRLPAPVEMGGRLSVEGRHHPSLPSDEEGPMVATTRISPGRTPVNSYTKKDSPDFFRENHSANP